MKRAKFALTAVAILAVIGGALAFKANSGSVKIFYVADGQTNCTAPSTVLLYTVDTINGTYTLTDHFSTTTIGACPGTKLRPVA